MPLRALPKRRRNWLQDKFYSIAFGVSKFTEIISRIRFTYFSSRQTALPLIFFYLDARSSIILYFLCSGTIFSGLFTTPDGKFFRQRSPRGGANVLRSVGVTPDPPPPDGVEGSNDNQVEYWRTRCLLRPLVVGIFAVIVPWLEMSLTDSPSWWRVIEGINTFFVGHTASSLSGYVFCQVPGVLEEEYSVLSIL